MAKILIQDNGSVLVILNNGKQDTVPNTTYNRLKIGVFEGNQISHKFGDEITITETYDDGIFNCITADGKVDLQSRQSDQIADAIVKHQNDGKLDTIQGILLKELKPSYELKAIDEFLQPFYNNGRIVKFGKHFMVDNRFSIDEFAKVSQLVPKTESKNEYWNGMCVVIKNTLIPFDISTPVGVFTLDSRAIEVLSKILFLLKPNMKDGVFVDQLKYDLKEQLMSEFPPPPDKCERTTNIIDRALLEFIACDGTLSSKHPDTEFKVCSECSFPAKKDEVEHYAKLKELSEEPLEGTLEVFQNDDTAEAD